MTLSRPYVTSVSRSQKHNFSKHPQASIRLLTGLGVEGDAHAGATIQHRSRVKKDPHQPNLRQVHLFEAEGLQFLCENGFGVEPGDLGENITTSGIDLHRLPVDTQLLIGTARIQIKGLRNPCRQLDNFQAGLMNQLREKVDGALIRKGGVMGVVLAGGLVSVEDGIDVMLPQQPHLDLLPV